MYSSSSGWRDLYYAQDLAGVLLVFARLETKPSLADTFVRVDTHFDETPGFDEQQYSSPLYTDSDRSSNPMDSPATTLTCSTFLGSSDSSGNNSNTVLAPNSTSSKSPVELSSPASNTSLYCHICNKSFHCKKDQDQRTNRNRHIVTKHTSRMVPCSEPGCDKEFTRSDNMGRHSRKYHGGCT